MAASQTYYFTTNYKTFHNFCKYLLLSVGLFFLRFKASRKILYMTCIITGNIVNRKCSHTKNRLLNIFIVFTGVSSSRIILLSLGGFEEKPPQ